MNPTLDTFKPSFLALAEQYYPYLLKEIKQGDWEAWHKLCLISSAYGLGYCDGIDEMKKIYKEVVFK